jgi:hypothetical protein
LAAWRCHAAAKLLRPQLWANTVYPRMKLFQRLHSRIGINGRSCFRDDNKLKSYRIPENCRHDFSCRKPSFEFLLPLRIRMIHFIDCLFVSGSEWCSHILSPAAALLQLRIFVCLPLPGVLSANWLTVL